MRPFYRKIRPAHSCALALGRTVILPLMIPHVAGFSRPAADENCGAGPDVPHQQVHDGCFQEISQVPARAMTLTIPALISAPYHFCMVPAPTKAQAVYRTVTGPIEEACPASILRTCRQTVLYLDQDSGALL